MNDLPPFRDLGLSYLDAAHGVQSAVALRISQDPAEANSKHLRVGIDLSKAEQAGLARLLIDKGLFTITEYEEYMRLAVNEELAREQDTVGVIFR